MSNKTIKMPTPAPVESSSVRIKKLKHVNVNLPATKARAPIPRVLPSIAKMEDIGMLNTSKPAQYHTWELNHTFHSLFAISGDPKKDGMFLRFLPKFNRPPRPDDSVYHMRQLAFYNKGNKIFNLAYVDAELLNEPEVVMAVRTIKRSGKVLEENQTWTVLIPLWYPSPDDRVTRLIERFCYTLVRLDAIDVEAVVQYLDNENWLTLRDNAIGKEASHAT